MTRERAELLAHLDAERRHVLAAVEGLSEQDLTQAAAPSGWSIAQLLNHLTYDDEIFWAGAVLGGDEECIGLIQDGWKVPVTSGAEAVAQYHHWARHSDAVLAEVDLNSPPAGGHRKRSFPFHLSLTHADACTGFWWRRPPMPATSTSLANRSTGASTSWSGRGHAGCGHSAMLSTALTNAWLQRTTWARLPQ